MLPSKPHETRTSQRAVTFAAVGDVHGSMHAMVGLLREWEEQHGQPIDFVLQVGDFEPHRTEADLATMAAPAKYRKLGDFPEYLHGGARFPWPVYFIGGNHEPYGFLDRMPEGGLVAENCFYLGRSGRVEVAGLRIVGLSGIYCNDGFALPRPDIREIERVSNKAYIHFVEADVERALDHGSADILLLHEWPSGLVPTESPIGSPIVGETGNEYARLLVEALQPRLVLCGHMHERFRGAIRLASGRIAEVCCLAKVDLGAAALAVFTAEPDGTIRSLLSFGASPPEP